MKNILLIIVPLVLTIILGVFIQNILHKDADKMSQELYKLNEAVNNNNWKAASDQMNKINSVWKPIRPKWQALIDHMEVDRIDESFTRIRSLIASEDYTECLAEIAVLKQTFLHIPEKEKVILSNIF